MKNLNYNPFLINIINCSYSEVSILYFDYSGKKIFYQVKDNNSRNALIFIHGSGGNSNIWKDQFNLRIEYNIYALDLPSHGNSDKFSELFLDLYVDVVRKFVETLDLRNVILCGHSLGGAVIQYYYFKHPFDTVALILTGTGSRLRVNPLILENLKNNFQEYLDNIEGAFYRNTSKALIEDFKKELVKTDPSVIYNDFKICDDFDTLDKTSSIKVPCLIICGNYDQLTPLKYSQFFHDKIYGSELVIIKKAGHMVMIEQSKKVNKAIENFINNHLINK